MYNKPVPAWPAASFEERVRDCLAMLHIHGVLTDGEWKKAKGRVAKVVKEHREACDVTSQLTEGM